MKKIVMLGSSAAIPRAIEAIRGKDKESTITLMAMDGHYPYAREAFFKVIADEVPPVKAFCRPKDFYAEHQVNILADRALDRINFRRKRITLDNKDQIDYDVLLITEAPKYFFPEHIKGTNKNRVYALRSLKDIKALQDELLLGESVCLRASGIVGLKTALALLKRKKEVTWVSPQTDLGLGLPPEVIVWLTEYFKGQGSQILAGTDVQEVLGDSDAKAVRITSGKVFAANIFICTEQQADLRLLAESIFQMDGKVKVDMQFATNDETVFALDDLIGPIQPAAVVAEQGRVAGLVMAGDETQPQYPLAIDQMAVAKDCPAAFIGEFQTLVAQDIRSTWDAETVRYRKLVVREGRLVGAILWKDLSQVEEIKRLIQEKTDISERLEQPFSQIQPQETPGAPL